MMNNIGKKFKKRIKCLDKIICKEEHQINYNLKMKFNMEQILFCHKDLKNIEECVRLELLN